MNQDMSADQQVELIELSTKQAEEKIALRTALRALQKNANFKKVLGQYYLKDYAVRLVNLKASPGMQDAKHQAFIDGQLAGIGYLAQFMSYIEQEGNAAEKLIAANEAELEYLHEQGA